MLSKEDNELVTRVGPGTPMGELMRQYWVPAMAAEELSDLQRDRLELQRHRLKQRAGRFRMIEAKAEPIRVQRSGVECDHAGKRILADVAMRFVEKLERDRHVRFIHVIDLADKRDVWRAICRAGT